VIRIPSRPSIRACFNTASVERPGQEFLVRGVFSFGAGRGVRLTRGRFALYVRSDSRKDAKQCTEIARNEPRTSVSVLRRSIHTDGCPPYRWDVQGRLDSPLTIRAGSVSDRTNPGPPKRRLLAWLRRFVHWTLVRVSVSLGSDTPLDEVFSSTDERRRTLTDVRGSSRALLVSGGNMLLHSTMHGLL